MSIATRLRGMAHKAAGAAFQSITGVSLTDLRLGAFLAGGPSISGQRVSVDTALQLDTVWACIRLLSETIGSMPLKLHERQGDGQSSMARDHPLYRVLALAPNADMTPIEFWSCMAACCLAWGNGFAQIMWRGDGQIVALNPLRPDRMTVERNPNTGALVYRYSYQGKTLVLGEGDIFHIKGFCFDGLMGISPITAGRQSIGAALAAEETAGRMFRNGLLSQNYISAPTLLTSVQREQAKVIMADYTGAMNAGKTPLLEGGWKVESIGLKAEDMQLLQTRQLGVATLCRWFGVQPVMIGSMEKSTAWGTGLEQMNLWFLQYALMPWLQRIEQAVARCLLLPAERDRYFARFNVDALLRGDSTARAGYMQTALRSGWMTVNEARANDNLPPMPGGDVLMVQAQMIPLADIGKPRTLTGTGGQDPPASNRTPGTQSGITGDDNE
ncbi:phage portal protein [Asaia bogorensis]|uniref:phage portal protein n=1 Tax=Asaia bogorensis TaxID=91915 RepID=UPI000EFD17A5|nr:phage portal protein [Asaia bogorensis]